MKTAFCKASLILSFIFIGTYATAQEMMVPVPLTARVNEAMQVVEGKVVAQTAYWNETHTLIFTSTTVEVYKIFKGNASRTIIVETMGGRVGMDVLVVEPELQLQPGDVGVFLLKPAAAGRSKAFQPVASTQGFIRYDLVSGAASDVFHQYKNISRDVYSLLQAQTGSPFREIAAFQVSGAGLKTSTALAPPNISGFSPAAITAGTFSVLTINGTDFGATFSGPASVSFRNANDGGASFMAVPAANIVSWSNTQIQVIVPSHAGTGTVRVVNDGGESGISAASITITYNQLNVGYDHDANAATELRYFEPNLINRSGSGGYNYAYSTATANAGVSFDADVAAKERFESALQTWRCNTGLNFNVTGSTAVQNAASDGVFLVAYDNNGSPLPSGVLGRATSFYNGCSVGASFFWFVNDIDIVFKRNGTDVPAITWYTGSNAAAQPGGTFDLETVALHELGHHHQLGHIIAAGAVMHYAVSMGTNNRVLSATRDVAGGNYVMSHSTVFSNCGRTGMTASNCAPQTDFTGNTTATCGTSLTVNFTDNSTNTPSSWSWSFPGGVPATSTLQHPTVTYSAAGQYSVSLTATNGSGSSALTRTNYIDLGSYPSTTTYTFETAITGAGVQLINTDNATTWQQADVTGSNGLPTKAAYMDHYDYGMNINTTDELILPKYDLGAGSYEFRFDIAYAPYDAANYDGLEVLLSTDCGVTYPVTLYSAAGAALSSVGSQTTEFNPSASGQWRTQTIDLTAYASQVIKLKFVAYNGYGNNLYIDNVQMASVVPLPVQMTAFRAVVNEAQLVALSWSTSSETNSKWFVVERALAYGNDWISIGTVMAAGNSTTVREYGFTDGKLAPGAYQYRIRQVDQDNRYRLSQIARITIRGAATSFHVYPNPAQEQTFITTTETNAKNIAIRVFDAQGRTLMSRSAIISQASPFQVDLKQIRQGTYFIQILSDGKTTTEKLVVR
jgi:PKD repeat protein